MFSISKWCVFIFYVCMFFFFITIQIQIICYKYQKGLLCIIAGFCRAGILVNMLATPVITGFTFAAAFLIGSYQFKFVF